MENNEFKSELKDEISLFLLNRKLSLSESTYNKTIHYMHDFDDFLIASSSKDGCIIDEALIEKWILTHSNSSRGTIQNYINAVRSFLTFYAELSGEKVYIPACRKCQNTYSPYLLSDEEFGLVISEADNYNSASHNMLPYIHIELPLILRLLDSCGFRITELLSTQMTEVNLQDGILKMKNTKKSRERFVPLEENMSKMLCEYCNIMKLYENTTAYLFPRMARNEPLKDRDILSRYKKILIKLGIRNNGPNKNRRGPCIHDLRHRYTLRAIKQLLSLGITIEDSVPYLSVYLGHKSISQTEHYMKFFADMFPDELNKFENIASSLAPSEEVWDDWM